MGGSEPAASPCPRATTTLSACGGLPEGADSPELLEQQEDKHQFTMTRTLGLVRTDGIPRRATIPPPLRPPESYPAVGNTLLGLQTLDWMWREVGCQGSAADCSCSFTFSASPRNFQDSRGTDASQLCSVASGGWIHPNSLQHRTSSIPELSSSPPWSQQSAWISRQLMRKATPLHPFSRQQNLFPGEGTAAHQAHGIQGLSASWQEQPHCSPCSVATWQPGPGRERDAGFGSPWWPVVGCVRLSPGGWIPSHQSNGIRINDCCSIPGPALPSVCANQIQCF